MAFPHRRNADLLPLLPVWLSLIALEGAFHWACPSRRRRFAGLMFTEGN
ncbi:hypothetical protein [Devosia sp.]|nr:hypothetical protein [Devosia sp.]